MFLGSFCFIPLRFQGFLVFIFLAMVKIEYNGLVTLLRVPVIGFNILPGISYLQTTGFQFYSESYASLFRLGRLCFLSRFYTISLSLQQYLPL
jgi:hypothetical protein